MAFTSYSILYLATAVVSYVVGWLAQGRKSVVGAKELSTLTYLVSFCAFVLCFESASMEQETKILLTKISYISVVQIPVFYLLFVIRFTKLLQFKDLRYGWMLFVFPFITLVLAFTNEYHHWLWSGFSPISPITNIMTYQHGFWFWIGYTLYSYLLLTVATHFLLEFLRFNRHRKVYVVQGWLVAFAGLCPWAVSLFYITGINPVQGLDITPISTALSAILFSWSIMKSTFLNMVPLAREKLVETLPIGILALDDQNRIQDINGTAKEFMEIQTNDILGVPLSQAVPTTSSLLDSLESEFTPLLVETTVDGSEKTFRIIKLPLKGILGSRLITIFDVTMEIQRQEELIKARKKAEENDQLKSAFLSNLSHEIRTPLNGIMGFISILQREDLTEAERSEYLNIVWENGDRLLKTMVDIIDISKIESGQIEVSYSEVDIQVLLVSLFDFFKSEAANRKLDFHYTTHMEPDQKIIHTDLVKIYSIFTNLIKNALKYTIEGFVKFDCTIQDNEMIFTISDSGIGLPADKLEVIFDRFVQVDSTRMRKFEGSGLGLSITKAYVEILGGSIQVESVEHSGSTFTVRLPIH
ncbi:MAG TPA: histidine kinase N-terminal 7TM domain-containing protein [Bacteroidales bacterium]|nr:histidine kinase N-terminal 7TM domain-containing protein [Bacteroidales bacterium]